jgi:TatD DNase family protein
LAAVKQPIPITIPIAIPRNRENSGILQDMGFLIDTHAHLCDPLFDPDREQVLQKARAAGISAVIAVGESLEDAEKNLLLAERHPMMLPAAGLYPTILDLGLAERMGVLIRNNRERLAAIGEVGLDYWMVKDEADRETQRAIFRSFIELSKELDLPLNVHSRSAGRHAVSLLLECSAPRVQLHAFDGKFGAAMPAVEAGFFFSVPPSIVRSEQKQKLVKNLPLSCLLIETDSPVLGPVAQERNEPANAHIAVQAIAELKGLEPDAVVETMAENTQKLYRLA